MTKDQTRQRKNRFSAKSINWSRPHHSPLFWIGVVLFMAGAAFFVLSDNLTFAAFGQ
jgi:drug/metabolite transporter (DMT)-like permease